MSTHTETTRGGNTKQGAPSIAWVSWAWVAVPFLYGLYALVIKIPALFGT